ncbi:mannose-1-phosphate guanylyltransferase [Porphyromonas macacae]|uniref:mannose-1-phosphate guanylyltransferase n=1 Tax=Porphyromonas macacae TaxID=28115 RepID=UPI0024AD7168|nr:mannose-1-phosphate guanylyltransferase [Porphyromonas macacae]
MGGGIGSRFWPLSRENNPKQFIDFFGTGQSLLQATYRRFLKFILPENIFVVTNEQYGDKIREQLPELSADQILLEPTRRNTAPAIAYASYRILTRNPDANIVVAPSDHLILREEDFVKAIEKSLAFVADNDNLVTMGIRPSHPETGYGYIQMDDVRQGDFINVKTFTEKPNLEMAKLFVNSGEFLWNSGIFVWNVQSIIRAFRTYLPEVSTALEQRLALFDTPGEADYIRESFPLCPNISIDYGIMEKTDLVMVLPVDFGWADLGTWGALYDLSPKDEQQNVSLRGRVQFYESERNIVFMDDPERLVVIQGLTDCVVAESENVLLICKKSEEQRIKQFAADATIRFDNKYN